MTSARVLGALAIVAGARIAQADPAPASPAPAAAAASAEPAPSKPDPEIVDAADEANLVSVAPRQGLTFAAAVGPSLTIGLGVRDAVGRGGGVSLRFGHVATPHTIITFEILGSGFLHATGMSQTSLDSSVLLLAGAQVYTSPSLWLRAAGGAGTLTRANSPGDPLHVTGLSAAVGIGVDIAQLRFFTLDIELDAASLLAGGGLTMSSTLCLGGAIY